MILFVVILITEITVRRSIAIATTTTIIILVFNPHFFPAAQ